MAVKTHQRWISRKPILATPICRTLAPLRLFNLFRISVFTFFVFQICKFANLHIFQIFTCFRSSDFLFFCFLIISVFSIFRFSYFSDLQISRFSWFSDFSYFKSFSYFQISGSFRFSPIFSDFSKYPHFWEKSWVFSWNSYFHSQTSYKRMRSPLRKSQLALSSQRFTEESQSSLNSFLKPLSQHPGQNLQPSRQR